MNKKRGALFLLTILSIISIITITTALYSGTHHAQSEVIVEINGHTMTLQKAITSNYLTEGGPSPTQSFPVSSAYSHQADKIYVNVNNQNYELSEAIYGPGLCSSTDKSYSGPITIGHSAEEIEITTAYGTKNLQEAINDGDFCCIDTSWSPSPSTVCTSDSPFTQTSNCGNARFATGTKNCCVDTSWTPDPSTVCSGEFFPQWSNCGNARPAIGTKDCDCVKHFSVASDSCSRDSDCCAGLVCCDAPIMPWAMCSTSSECQEFKDYVPSDPSGPSICMGLNQPCNPSDGRPCCSGHCSGYGTESGWCVA